MEAEGCLHLSISSPYAPASSVGVASILPVTDRVASNIVTLPIYPGLTPEQREHVVGSVKAALLVAKKSCLALKPPLVILSVIQPWPSRRPSAPA